MLDIGLPDGDGHRLCARLQADERTRNVPVVFLSGSDQIRDKITAFSLGAEDYIEKPFDPAELRARIEARLTKVRARRELAHVLERPGLRLHVEELRAFGIEGGSSRRIDLTPNEFRVLHYLARFEGRVFTRKQILDAVWGDVVVSERTVDSHICSLRRKLGPGRDCVQSVRGLGYCFSARSGGGGDEHGDPTRI